MYTYKDHEYKLSPVLLLACCWDQRAKKPTSLFWALFCILSFAAIHWYFSGAQPQNTEKEVFIQQHPDEPKPDDQKPENPKFKGQYPEEPAAQLIQTRAVEPDSQIQHIIQENAPQVPAMKDLFVRDWHQERGDQPHPPKDHNDHRPSPKDFPVPYLNEPACGTEEYSVIVLVEDRPDNTGARLAIRSTWGIQDEVKFPKIRAQSWRTIFIMGSLRGNNADYFNGAVNAENKKFGDILQGDFEDNAHESTRKFMMALKWLNENQSLCKTKFVLKTRDDIYLNMYSITEWLSKRWGPDDKMLYVGRLLKNDVPIRNPIDPLYVSVQDYSKDFFPNFIEGPVFLFDWSAFERLHTTMKSVTPIAMDDAYVGILAEKAMITPQHNDHFQLIKTPESVCARLKIFFINKMLPKDHIDVFTTIKSARVKNLCPNAKIQYHKEGGGRKHFEI